VEEDEEGLHSGLGRIRPVVVVGRIHPVVVVGRIHLVVVVGRIHPAVVLLTVVLPTPLAVPHPKDEASALAPHHAEVPRLPLTITIKIPMQRTMETTRTPTTPSQASYTPPDLSSVP